MTLPPPPATHTRGLTEEMTQPFLGSLFSSFYCPVQDSWLGAWGRRGAKLSTAKKQEESTLPTPTK